MIDAFARGTRVPFDGLGHVRTNPKLWPSVLTCALVNTLITLLALALLIASAWWLIAWVWPMFGDSFWQWVWRVLAVIAAVVVAVGGALMVWLVLLATVAGYLLGRLAEQVERGLGLTDDQINPVPMSREAYEGLRDASRVAVIQASAFAAQFVPVIGTLIATPAALLANAYILGAEVLNYPMGVRGMTIQDRLAFVRAHRPEAVGIGAVMIPIGMVPVLGGFGMAFAVVGSVVLYRELIEGHDQASNPSCP